MISPPKKNKKRAVARAVIESVAQANPLTGALARIYQTTHPSETERDRDRWEVEVTDRVNDLPSQDEMRQLTDRVMEMPSREEFQRRQPILASGDIGSAREIGGFGMSSVTDNGIGDWTINLDTALDTPYHVSVEVPEGYANVDDKTATGFRVRTKENGEAIDTEISFRVIR